MRLNPYIWKLSAKVLTVFAVCLSVLGFISNYDKYDHYSGCFIDTSLKFMQDTEESSETLTFHPFENSCQFPFVSFYADDIKVWRHSERLRTLKCDSDRPLATQDVEGYLYIHPHLANYPNKTESNECEIDIIEGGLRSAITGKGKDSFEVVKTLTALTNVRLLVNADAFIVRCRDRSQNQTVWSKAFPGMYQDEYEPNTIHVVPDLESFDNYGVERRSDFEHKKKKTQRYSIDVLGFDSTSRSMFYRQLPRTVQTMKRLGYHIFHGYHKVGDNSMVNLAPIFVGDVPEAIAQKKLDESGDINSDWILPSDKQLDPTNLRFLWQYMKKKYGCKTMFNEDISVKFLGLFTYPNKEFKPGFTSAPADHYYRAYYLAVYNNWKYGPCKDGTQIQREFVDLWQRFAHQYKDICHFGFSFITTLTHETGLYLELLDEHISSRLDLLHETGSLDKAVSVLLGDHGNRIGLVQYTYTGRIEERMPLMAVRLPSTFKTYYPTQYSNFLENKYKLTSNFDIHQMLKDVVDMKFELGRKRYGRGISLFEQIPSNRTCFDAYVPENFCTCQQDMRNVTNLVNKITMKSTFHIKAHSLSIIRQWIYKKKLAKCIDPGSIHIEDKVQTLSVNPYVRHGLRSKANLTLNHEILKKPNKYEYLNHNVHIRGKIMDQYEIKLLFRIDNYVINDSFNVSFEPAIIAYEDTTISCSETKSLIDLCICINKTKSK